MGLNFRKSVSLGKYFRLNFSKSGVGFSVGRKGIRYTKSATGASRATLSLPGTGLSYSVPLSKKGKKAKNTAEERRAERAEKRAEKKAAALEPVTETSPAPLPAPQIPEQTPAEHIPQSTAPSVQPVGVFHASGTAAFAQPQISEASPDASEDQPEAERIVYFSATGKCYHYLPACSGHSLPRSSTESEAVAAGKSPCSKCRM